MIDTTPVEAVLMPKGGVGKTLNAVTLAKYLADEGKFVVLIDGDPQPGASEMFARHQEMREGTTGLMEQVKRAPTHRSLIRLITQPERDLDNFFEFPITGSGQLVIVPNAGEFGSLMTALAELQAANRTMNPDLALVSALNRLHQTRATQGKRPIDVVVIDTPGERSTPFARMVYFATNAILIPLMPGPLALSAALNAIDDIQLVQARRGGLPRILPILPNAIKSRAQETRLRTKASAALAEKGIALYSGVIPYNDQYDEVLDDGLLPFESHALDNVTSAIRRYYEEVSL